jgi:hypothetical protein
MGHFVKKLPAWRTLLKIGAPLIAIFTLMIGLRIGAGEAVRAAVVFGAPLGQPAPDGKTRIAWQVLTFLDDRGVKETIPMSGLSVVARSKGREARWDGASNGDGIAEVALEMEGIAWGDPIDLEVRVAGDETPLATGRVTWGDAQEDRAIDALTARVARPTVRKGAIGLDVVIEGERLIAGFPTSAWVHATPPAGVAASGIAIDVEPEPGLLADREKATTCGAGWAEFPLTAQAHVTGATFLAHSKTADEDSGRWFGALPVAAGAFFIRMPRTIDAGVATSAELVAPNPRDVVYAEIDDTHGRIVAAALPVKNDGKDPTPRARFDIPPLAPGLYWLVVSGEPRGAEHMAGAAVAKTFLAGTVAGVDVHDACTVGPWLAQRPATGFPRWTALDGLPARSASNRFRHLLGLLIGVLSLFAAGVLETLLLVAASREARVALQIAELDEDDPAGAKITARTPGGGVVMAVLIVVLGLALLAVLLIAKG